MERYKYALPVEQWRQVLVNNSPRDLCNVVLTSRYMNSVASLPELWAGMKVNKRKVREKGLTEFYNIHRFKKVKEVNLEWYGIHGSLMKDEEFERLLNEIPGSPLENANLSCNNLSGVSAELLARGVSHLYIVNLSGSGLTVWQSEALLKASLTSTTLAKVNLATVNLSEVPAELLASSISRLQDVNLRRTGMTSDQSVALLKASLSSTTLAKVNLDMVNLSKVPAELLASSISRLQDVNLRRTGMKSDQSVALLKASLSSTTLAKVNLTKLNLYKVPPELLASSISRLQDVNLCRTEITSYQCVALLKASLSSTTLAKVNLAMVNLSEVPAELLSSSISRLQDINLAGTRMTTEQRVVLLKASLSSTTLAKVNLMGVNLSEVPAELLASSISRLQDVNLSWTCLTTNQYVAVLKIICSSRTLHHIDLYSNNNKFNIPIDQRYLLGVETAYPYVKVKL